MAYLIEVEQKAKTLITYKPTSSFAILPEAKALSLLAPLRTSLLFLSTEIILQ
jgi:hypothetical protein